MPNPLKVIAFSLNHYLVYRYIEILCTLETMKTVKMSNFPSRCYYCDTKDFGSVNGYERHIVTRHPSIFYQICIIFYQLQSVIAIDGLDYYNYSNAYYTNQ